MNNTSLLSIENSKTELLKGMELDGDSIKKFRGKIKKVDKATQDNLGRELFESINTKLPPDDKAITKITQLILNGADVNYKDNRKGDFPLLVCARKDQNYLLIAFLLLKAGANVNLTNNYKTTALMAAARHGNKELVKLLITLGADVNAECLDGDTALMSAKMHDQQECFDILVNAQAHINHRNQNTCNIFEVKGNVNFDSCCLLDRSINPEEYILATEMDAEELIKEAQKRLIDIRNR